MASDLQSTLVPYASAADLLLVYDQRLVGQTFKTDNTQATESEILSSETVENALLSASGDVESAIMVGGMYTLANLQQLAFPSSPSNLTASGRRLKRIVCNIAFWRLWCFRHPFDAVMEKFPGVVEAFADLEKIQDGQAIFGLAGAIDAGLPETVDWVNPRDYSRHVLQAYRFFPIDLE